MPIRILIADDHDLVAEGLHALIAAQGDLEVIAHVSDGRGAVKRAQLLKPDIALMDITMPQLNGIDATREIAARAPETRVIIVSMHSNPEHVYRAIEAGAAGYLVKRSAGRELIKAIRAVHSGRRFFGENLAESVISRYVGKDAPKDPVSSLSARERQVLQLLAEGQSVSEIGAVLNISPKTVETYRARLAEKLGIGDLASLIRFAIQHGITPLE